MEGEEEGGVIDGNALGRTVVGGGVGLFVGELVGSRVGDLEGELLGEYVGDLEGNAVVGDIEGEALAIGVGCRLGA